MGLYNLSGIGIETTQLKYSSNGEWTSDHYGVSDTDVYFYTFGYHTGVKVRMDADIDTIQALDGYYAKDVDNVFYKGVAITGADPDSFELIEYQDTFAKDEDSIYSGSTLLKDFDPDSFIVFDNLHYAKDNNQVYYYDSILRDVDAEAFAELDTSEICPAGTVQWAVFYDGENYYADGRQIKLSQIECQRSYTN